jgi:hypothetical protein
LLRQKKINLILQNKKKTKESEEKENQEIFEFDKKYEKETNIINDLIKVLPKNIIVCTISISNGK